MIRPEEELSQAGDMYPRFTFSAIELNLDHNDVVVVCQGDTPLFKTQMFEIAMKNWLKNEFGQVRKAL